MMCFADKQSASSSRCVAWTLTVGRRLEAKHLGLALIGSAAVIGLAKTEGLIPAARPLLDQMVAAGYFIGPSVVSAVLCELGE
jgi:predicted nucleic acid-binding protein